MIKLKVDGMTCDHCVRAVTQALSKVAGVEKVVEVNLDRGEATVEGRPDAAQLVAAVSEEGFQARVIQ